MEQRRRLVLSCQDYRKTFAATFALLLLVSAAGAQPGATYLITRVVDGDTVVVERIGTVRLIGVDTPETVDPRRPVQRFGNEASDFTRGLAAGKRARLEYDWDRTDDYGRTLAYVHLPDGVFLNAEIIRQGYGFAYTRFPFKYLEEFRNLEREAREAGRGLWAPETPAVPAVRRPDPGPSASGNAVVYITRAGKRYHRAGCSYLARGQIPLALNDAVKKYGACDVCRPPTR